MPTGQDYIEKIDEHCNLSTVGLFRSVVTTYIRSQIRPTMVLARLGTFFDLLEEQLKVGTYNETERTRLFRMFPLQ